MSGDQQSRMDLAKLPEVNPTHQLDLVDFLNRVSANVLSAVRSAYYSSGEIISEEAASSALEKIRGEMEVIQCLTGAIKC